MENKLSGLKMAMNKLVQSQKRGQTGGNGQSQDGKEWELSGITCLKCHKKGHFQDNRHLSKKAGASSGNEEK